MGKERREKLNPASAMAIVAQAEALSQAGGESRDPRLPTARGIVAELERQKSLAAENAGNGMGSLGRALKRFCGPCDNLRNRRCIWRLDTQALMTNICTEASVRNRLGTMTIRGFQPHEL